MRESLAQALGIGPTPPVSLPLPLPRSRTLPLTLTLIVARAQAGAAAVPYISIYLLYLPISPYIRLASSARYSFGLYCGAPLCSCSTSSAVRTYASVG